MDPKLIDSIARSLAASMPEGLRTLQEDLESNFKSVLQSALGQLELVTREEFELNTSMLRKTRKKLDAIQERMSALEARLDDEPADE